MAYHGDMLYRRGEIWEQCFFDIIVIMVFYISIMDTL